MQKGLADMGVPISSVAPNAMLAFDWDFMKSSAMIANPFKGSEPFIMDMENFHSLFCNTMSIEDAREAYEHTATHDSRNVLRDCMGAPGEVTLDQPHAPLLFIGGREDKIIPYELNQRNAEAYTDDMSICDFKAFMNRSHWICGQHGWKEVAAYVCEWLRMHEEFQYNTTSAIM
jgi:pimeloyl-ACP methyl ester carboxylesterase